MLVLSGQVAEARLLVAIDRATGDIFAQDVEALVNTVNCKGVMGRGIALEFKKRFPENFKEYKAACDRGEVKPGQMFIFEMEPINPQLDLFPSSNGDELTQRITPRLIVNFPTKRHWRAKSRMEDIDSGLEALRQEIVDRDIKSIAIPPLGCGLGGLRWDDVRPRIESMLHEIEGLHAVVLEPGGYAR